jgi:hypothetical protein
MSFPRYNPEGVGCKGGTSRTAGKKQALYEFIAPEAMPIVNWHWTLGGDGELRTTIMPKGTRATLRTFKHTADEVRANPMLIDGKWRLFTAAATIRPGETVVIGKRVK